MQKKSVQQLIAKGSSASALFRIADGWLLMCFPLVFLVATKKQNVCIASGFSCTAMGSMPDWTAATFSMSGLSVVFVF
jgi:hypothetical protein